MNETDWNHLLQQTVKVSTEAKQIQNCAATSKFEKSENCVWEWWEKKDISLWTSDHWQASCNQKTELHRGKKPS